MHVMQCVLIYSYVNVYHSDIYTYHCVEAQLNLSNGNFLSFFYFIYSFRKSRSLIYFFNYYIILLVCFEVFGCARNTPTYLLMILIG